MNPYLGHTSQLYGVEEHRLVGGKGDGMRLFEVRNGLGLECTMAADRCADLYRLRYKGVNCGYFSAAGHVHPAYFDEEGLGFLKSFTGGFLTTCGLSNVGVPNDDGGRQGLHGTIGNTPADRVDVETTAEAITLRARVNPCRLFGPKLVLERALVFSLRQNRLEIHDRVENEGGEEEPLLILYHMNLGYPLLSPRAELTVGCSRVEPRDARAAEDLDTWDRILEPTPGFVEQCYYHTMGDLGIAQLANPEAGLGLKIEYDPRQMDSFTQWKMMGVRDYVLGLEPGNCQPDGRAAMRQKGMLKTLAPGACAHFDLQITLFDA